MGELLGYARTSAKEQRLDLQLDALRAAGVKERYLYSDQASGARKDRPGFLWCLHDLREGDRLVVWKLDRLARSLRHCIELLDELKTRQVQGSSWFPLHICGVADRNSKALFASSGAPLLEPPQRRAGAPPERPGARRRTALHGAAWLWLVLDRRRRMG